MSSKDATGQIIGSDSLSIHMYQEAERLEGKGALRTTLANFVSRLLVALSFVFIVITV